MVRVYSKPRGPAPKGNKGKHIAASTKGGHKAKPVTVPPLKLANKLVAVEGGCEEASVLSADEYIPCNQPAVRMIGWPLKKEGPYRMCEACADHSVKNRGAKDLGPYKGKKSKGASDVLSEINAPALIISEGRKLKKIVEDDLEKELGTTTASKEDLANLSKQVTEAAKLSVTIEGLEEMVKAHKQDLHNLTTRVIPDIMRAAHTSLHKTDSGVKVELKDFINGSLPKEDAERKKALKWLEKNGARDLIKTSFSLALGRGQKDAAEDVRKAFGKLGVTYLEKEDVHSQSLYAYARERMKNAEELPLDVLGLYVGQVAKIEFPVKDKPQP